MGKNILECKKLRKVYQGEGGTTLALDSFSASFPANGLVAVCGKSGSGKSTLLCLLSLMEKPTSGKAFYDGKDVSKFKERDKVRFLRQETAFVFQHYGLFEEKTVLENVLIPLRMLGEVEKKAKESASFLLEYLKLGGMENRIVKTLSGGEKQRVALARALAKSPRILFADEPTGALDEKNGVAVMEMISSISKTRLVIMVSHNMKLVEKYADRIIFLQDGKIKEDRSIRKNLESYQEEKLGTFSSRWKRSFLYSFLVEDFKRNALTFVTGALGLSCILLSIGYLYGNGTALKEESKKSLEYLSATIAKKEVVSSGDSLLVLTKTIKPTVEEANEYLSSFSSYSIEDNLSYFLPSQSTYQLGEKEYADASFIPIYDITLSEFGKELLVQGKADDEGTFASCYVNDAYASIHPNIVGERIGIEFSVPFEYLDVHDEALLCYSFEVKGVVKEFPFLNTPKIYYSHSGLREELSSIKLERFSEAFHREMSVLDCFESNLGGCQKEDRLVYFHALNEMEKVFEKMGEDGELTLSSSCYVAYSSLATLSEAFELCLLLLLGICFVGVIGITAMSFLSLFLKRRAEIALLFSLGARKREILSIFVMESALVSLLYTGVSLLLSPWVNTAFNRLLNDNFGMGNAIVSPRFVYVFDYGVPFIAIVATASLLLAILSSAIPVALSMKKGLRKELRDE